LDNRAELISGLRDVLALIPPTLPSSLRPTKSGAPILRQAYRGLGGLYLEPQQSLVDPRQRPHRTRISIIQSTQARLPGAPSLIHSSGLPEKPSHSTKNNRRCSLCFRLYISHPALASFRPRPLRAPPARKDTITVWIDPTRNRFTVPMPNTMGRNECQRRV